MKYLIIAGLLLATPAMAQTAPVTLPGDLVQRVFGYLKQGGTRNEGDALAQSVADAVQAAQREASYAERLKVAEERAAKAEAELAKK